MYMKSLCFKSRMVTLSFTLAILAGSAALSMARAEETELPPPAVGAEEDTPSIPTPAPQPEIEDGKTELDAAKDELPSPSLGEEEIRNQVNNPTVEEDVFLPPPAAQGAADYSSPIAMPASGQRSAADFNDADWRNTMNDRPAFTFDMGLVSRTFGTTAIPDSKTGMAAGASYRVANLGQTVFLHAYAGIAYTKLGDVVSFRNVREVLYHFGGMLEVGVGRRLSLLGGLMFRENDLKADEYKQEIDGYIRPNPMTQLARVGESRSLKLGLGGQYDFYVIPHGSLGVRGYVEQDMIYVGLTMSMEPAPRKRASLSGF